MAIAKSAETLARIQNLISVVLKTNQDGKRKGRSIRFSAALDDQIAEIERATGATKTEIVEKCVEQCLKKVGLDILAEREKGRHELLARLREEEQTESQAPEKTPGIIDIQSKKNVDVSSLIEPAGNDMAPKKRRGKPQSE